MERDIMTIALEADEPLYAMQFVHRSQRLLKDSTYVTLRRMVAKKFLTKKKAPDGKPRYTLTPFGRDVINVCKDMLAEQE
jgi:DNA-binding HxlR family transcriptional regulator